MEQPDFSRGHLDTTVHSMEKEVSLDAGGYGREGSDDFYRSRVSVRERRSQMVVQGGLEGPWVIHTSSVESGKHS